MVDFPKIISASQTRKADAFTMATEPIASIELMERASQAFTQAFVERIDVSKKILILCGTGNNGGDGLAVARMLKNKGYQVSAYLIKFSETLSTDCQINADKLPDVKIVAPGDSLLDLTQFDVVIDALLGSGLKRPLDGFLKKIVENVNDARRTVFSIDIPSGVFCDSVQKNLTAINADHVFSFQRPKLAFFFPEYGKFIKNWSVIPIGLNELFIQKQVSKFYLIDSKIHSLLEPRKRYSHKGSYGHALLVAGSFGKIGAAVLAAKSCLRSGAGLLTVYLPECGYTIMQSTVPEAMCSVDPEYQFLSECPKNQPCTAIGIGPGLGTHPITVKAFETLLESYKMPLVIDADGLNIIAQHKYLLEKIPENSILTPHIKEFDRLFGNSDNSLERFDKQIRYSKQYKIIIVLKDAHTAISSQHEEIFFNFTGNPGMATGGSGDVLTGIITGLLAQKFPSLQAALLGTYFHGLAGDKAAEKLGELGVIATDIINNLKIQP